MDHADSSGGGRPPQKELQGPRPTPLKVRKESHKIKKPPVAPPANNPADQHQQVPPHHQPPRQPVIIYTVSPKVIHIHPSEFMKLVQRLTGPDATSSSSTSNFTTSSSMVASFSSTSTSAHHVSGWVSPAARLASIEKTKMHPEAKKLVGPGKCDHRKAEIIDIDVDGSGGGSGSGSGSGGVMDEIERTVVFPGILSPGPGSLPLISPNVFAPCFHDPNNLNLQHHHDLSGSYLSSPLSTTFTSPNTMFSPNSLDFLQRVLDS